MPNNYTNIVTAIRRGSGNDDDDAEAIEVKEWATGLLERICPTPASVRHPDSRYMSDAQVNWCNATRGTKWDAYDVSDPIRLPGDCGAFMVAFSTAWSPPNEAMITLAIADAETRGIRILSWTGLDPYNDTAAVLHTHSHSPKE